ncbi:MAG: hypothetical protein QM820_33680 [Minicystis sp.]
MRMTQRGGLFGGVALLSCATLVLQIALTRLYSALFGNHLAFLAISLSLFGIGLGGVLLYVAPALARPPRLFSRLALLSVATAAASVISIVVLLRSKPVTTFDSDTLGRLGGLYLLCALPFVLVGIAVAAAIQHAARDISRLYLFDLVGAAAGGLGAIGALRAGGPRAVLIVAVLAGAAAVLFALGGREADGPYSKGERRPSVGLPAAVAILALASFGADLRSPWLKLPSLRYVPMDQVDFQAWNEMALITVDKPAGGMAWMRMDGGAATAILSPETTPPLHPDEMAYVLHRDRGPVLIIGAGGGRDLRAALKAGQKEVHGAEINPIIVEKVMRDRYAGFSGGLYNRPEVHVSVADGRSYVRRSPIRFRNIVISLVDTWAAASVGALSLSENSLYTVEAFADFIEHLEPEGTLTVNRWDSEFDRLLALGAAGLKRAGIEQPADHLFSCGHSRSTTLLVKRAAFTTEEIAALRNHCKANRFYEVFAPDAPRSEMRRHLAAAGNVNAIAPNHPTDLSPPTDDRPFFFYTVPTRRLAAALGNVRALEAQNQGLLTLLALLVVSVFLGVVLIVGPLLFSRVPVIRAADRGPRLRALGFFLCLGAAYVFVEVSLVQHFVMFLGHPVYALSTVLVALLLSTGLGSLLTAKLPAAEARGAASRRALILAAALVVAAFAVGPVLRALVSLPLGARFAVTLVLLAPLGLLMGSQAPLGVRLVESRSAALIPWCWGLNGVASVVATATGTLLAMHGGFSSLLLVGAAIYALAALVVPPATPVESAPSASEEASPAAPGEASSAASAGA